MWCALISTVVDTDYQVDRWTNKVSGKNNLVQQMSVRLYLDSVRSIVKDILIAKFISSYKRTELVVDAERVASMFVAHSCQEPLYSLAVLVKRYQNPSMTVAA